MYAIRSYYDISDLSWTKKIKHPAEFTNIGDEIEVVVLEIDVENRRLSLGHKQLEENPWDVFETIFTVGSDHEGTITEVMDKGAVVALQYGVEGFVTPRNLVKEDGTTAKLDEKLTFVITSYSIHYTKLYDVYHGKNCSCQVGSRGGRAPLVGYHTQFVPFLTQTKHGFNKIRITSYNVCYTKLLRPGN